MLPSRMLQLAMSLFVCLALLLAACGGADGDGRADPEPSDKAAEEPAPEQEPAAGPEPQEPPAAPPEPSETEQEGEGDAPLPAFELPENKYEAVEVVAEPASITVLVNKKYALPKDYVPDDLVEPDVPFIFEEKLEKRKLRKEAAEALEAMFAAAAEDGVLLAGVSGYRSYNTQKGLYNWYVSRDGQEAADRYSARPGHSEHSTGLAMDVSGIDGACAATDCFADTPEAAWLAEHAYDYGFIIRYPEGKEDITGYKYEPWHLRYVGVDAAREIRDLGLTLEEYTALRAALAASAGEASGPGASGDAREDGAVQADGTGNRATADGSGVRAAPDDAGEWTGDSWRQPGEAADDAGAAGSEEPEREEAESDE